MEAPYWGDLREEAPGRKVSRDEATYWGDFREEAVHWRNLREADVGLGGKTVCFSSLASGGEEVLAWSLLWRGPWVLLAPSRWS